MSRLDELIAELCPDGVEYFQLKTLCTRQKGTSITAGEMKTLDKPNAPIRIFAGGNTTAYVEYGDIPDSAVITKPSIIVKSRGNIGFEYYEKPFSHKNEMWSYSTEREDIVLKYIYYYLEHHTLDFQAKAKSGKLPQISTPDTDNYKIPLPPLEVQREIVRILDAFTELTAELTAELDARKKQYEYYRDDLLRFGDTVEWKPLGELFPFIRNGFVGTVTPYFTDAENGVRYLEGTNIHNGTITDNEVFYVTREFHEQHQRTELKADDILMVQSGHVGECAVVGDKYAGANCHALIVMSNGGKCNSRFIMHYFNSKEGKNKLKKITTGGTIKHILASSMKKYVVPLPPLAEQERIVAILDRFDKLCNDISVGIPAEIEARRKQYEHYRDRLLTFKEKTA